MENMKNQNEENMKNQMNNQSKLTNLSNSLKGFKNKIPKIKSLKVLPTTIQQIKKITLKKNKPRKKTITNKSAVRRMTIDIMFKDRIHSNLGLTKIEVLSEYLNQPKSQIIRLQKDKINLEFNKFKKIVKAMRKEGNMVIISKPLSIGHILYDVLNGQWGERILEKREHIWFKCTTNDEAFNYRGKMFKIGKGITECGEDVVNITRSNQKNKQVMKIMNGGKNQNANKNK